MTAGIITAATEPGQVNAMSVIAKQLIEAKFIYKNAAGKATTYMPRQSSGRFADDPEQACE